MNEFQIKTLWGENFHLVERGLSEADVVAFVEKLIERHQAESDKLQHVSSLKALATKVVEGAERLAAEIKAEAEAEGRIRSEALLAAAREEAEAIIDRSIEKAAAVEAEANQRIRDKVAELDDTFSTMREWSGREFESLKEIDGRIQAFVSAFNVFIGLLDVESIQGTTTQQTEPLPSPVDEDPQIDVLGNGFHPTNGGEPAWDAEGSTPLDGGVPPFAPRGD